MPLSGSMSLTRKVRHMGAGVSIRSGIMAASQNESNAHRWHLEVIQAGNLDLADEVVAPDVVLHVNGQEMRGVEQARGLAQALSTALSNIQITHHATMVQGDEIAIRWTSEGIHSGDYFGVPATGQRVHFEGIDWFVMKDGKI